MNSKVGLEPRRRLEFESGLPVLKAAKLKKFSDFKQVQMRWLPDAGYVQFLSLFVYILFKKFAFIIVVAAFRERKLLGKKFLSLFGLILVTLSFIIYIRPEFPLTFGSAAPKPKILITYKRGLGEKEMAIRIRNLCLDRGHESVALSLIQNPILKKLLPHYKWHYIQHWDPDIVISLEGEKIERIRAKQYAVLSHSSQYYFSPNSIMPIQNLLGFDGFLVSFPDKERLANFLKLRQISRPYMTWHQTCADSDFFPVSRFNLIYFGMNSTNSPTGQMTRSLFSLLDRTGYFNTYGKKEYWLHTPNSYRGLMSNDGHSIPRIIHKCGVALILHSDEHFDGKTPSARLFEAISAGAIIIADQNPFITEAFGDSVLYVDKEKSAEEIFSQIDRHMEWIRTHKGEAQAKAQKAHSIFCARYTLDKQLDELLAFHESNLRH